MVSFTLDSRKLLKTETIALISLWVRIITERTSEAKKIDYYQITNKNSDWHVSNFDVVL